MKETLKFSIDTFLTVCGCTWDNGGEHYTCNWFRARKSSCYKRQRKKRNWVGFFDTYNRKNGFFRRLYYRFQYTWEQIKN